MTIDIIALAKEAFLKTHGGIELNPDKFFIAWIECFSGMLEAEIRKEYENELEVEKVNGSMQFDLINDLKAKLSALTEQNTKLMEALEKAAKVCESWAATANIYGFNGDADNYLAIREEIVALTPQPEKEWKE